MSKPSPESTDSFGLERLIFFSDAVFAIAITLLVLEIRLPDLPTEQGAVDLSRQLLALWPRYLSYSVSFLVIGLYWMAHHRTFRYIRRYDRGLIWLNTCLLLFVAFIPFPTAVIGQHGDQPVAVAFYSAIQVVTSLLLGAIWWHASRSRRLVDADLDPQLVAQVQLRSLLSALVFLASMALALVSPLAAMSSWALLPLVSPAARRAARA